MSERVESLQETDPRVELVVPEKRPARLVGVVEWPSEPEVRHPVRRVELQPRPLQVEVLQVSRERVVSARELYEKE